MVEEMVLIADADNEPIESMHDGARGAGVAAVNRALQIMAAIESAHGPISLTEIARATGLYKSTALRLIESLQKGAYLARLEDGQFVLGAAILRMGLAYERTNPMRQQLLPVLKRLTAQGTESASFHVRQSATTRLCIMRVDSSHSTLDRVSTGDVLPLARGAAGKVILAHSGSNPLGANETDPRTNFVAISIGERDASCAGMAAPVFSAGNHFLGALSLSGPRERFGEADIERMKPLLLQACRDLTSTFSGAHS